jgi:hypothetical protein
LIGDAEFLSKVPIGISVEKRDEGIAVTFLFGIPE